MAKSSDFRGFFEAVSQPKRSQSLLPAELRFSNPESSKLHGRNVRQVSKSVRFERIHHSLDHQVDIWNLELCSTFQETANCFGIGDSRFRGGARAPLDDINGDGHADHLVGAGPGGGPQVLVVDGNALLRQRVVAAVNSPVERRRVAFVEGGATKSDNRGRTVSEFGRVVRVRVTRASSRARGAPSVLSSFVFRTPPMQAW